VVLLTSALLPGACGGGGGGDETEGKTVTATNGAITVTTPSGKLRFDATTIKAEPGELAVTYVNQDGQAHNFSIHDLDGLASADPGESGTGTFTLEAGKTYTFFCSLFGHEQQGMTGTVVVG
jgi:plastocyanin